MQTELAAEFRDSHEGREAEDILRKCVHCGFCTATCPTYQLLGDELDGPRGRIYLIKGMLEGEPVSASTRLHLDRCLSCRACETTCPSGVRYGRLADIGRGLLAERLPRPLMQRVQRWLIGELFSRSALFGLLLRLGQSLRALLPALFPAALAGKLPATVAAAGDWPAARHARRMLVLQGCVQPALSPRTNAAAARVLDRLGISLLPISGAGCCGALRYHLDQHAAGLNDMRRVIDACWPMIEAGQVEAIVITASGCGSMLKDYREVLAQDPLYAKKANKFSNLCIDLGELLGRDAALLAQLMQLAEGAPTRRLAYHPPCSLQHGQQSRGQAERVLAACGVVLTPVADSHLCCGSAGTYSLLQPTLSEQLRQNKLQALQAGAPEEIVTANIGCQSHLQAASALPVSHWIDALERQLDQAAALRKTTHHGE